MAHQIQCDPGVCPKLDGVKMFLLSIYEATIGLSFSEYHWRARP